MEDNRKDKGRTTSLYQVGSQDHLEDPKNIQSAFEPDVERAAPSEVTRLLTQDYSSEDTMLKRKKDADAKKQLFRWLIKFGVLSCILVAIITTVALMAVYLSNHRSNVLTGCVGSYDPEIDYFPEKLISFPYGLQVTYYNHYKFVRISNGQRYVLYQCGTPNPSGYFASRYFPVPAASLAVENQLPMTFVELLDKRTSVKFFGSVNTLVSACAQRMLRDGDAATFSDDASQKEEQVAQVDTVFSSAVASSEKYATLEFPDENHPKGRAVVWLQFVGSFFNQEKAANQLSVRISDTYDCHKSKAQALAPRPSVAFIDYSTTGTTETWYVLKNDDLHAYAQDAGAAPIKLIISSFSYVTDFHEAIANASVVIDRSGFAKDWELFKQAYRVNETSEFGYVKNSQIWRTDKIQNPSGASDWQEGAVAQPNAVLEDFISVFHPDYDKSHKRVWLRNLRDAEDAVTVQDASMCSSIGSSAPLLGSSCKPE